MATKSKARPKTAIEAKADKPRDVIELEGDPKVDRPDLLARALTKPHLNAAITIQRFQSEHEVMALARELQRQVEAVNGGDLKRAEGMLIAQAHTLDELFNSLARRAKAQEHLLQYETHFRLALKAQSQCRATLETLAQIKNPPIVYAKQANIANGPQQVNNGLPAPSQAGEKLIEQSKQSGGGNELLPDARASGIAGKANQAMEALGEIHRAEVWSG